MAMVKKRTYPSGKETWRYRFEAPWSTRAKRKHIYEAGFATKKAAIDAEAKRRGEVEIEHEAMKRGALAPVPKSLAGLLEEFCREHGERELAKKTVHRYRQHITYLSSDLLAMSLHEITPLHLKREWNRLLDSGGHHRKTKAARPLSAKTVRCIAGVVSSAFAKAIEWGLVTSNPTTNSHPPKLPSREASAYTTSQQSLLLDTAEAHWALPMILELAAATAARRGEVLALRWSDIRDGRAFVTRSLSQVKDQVFFKDVKTKKSNRPISLPQSTLAILDAHKLKQAEYRKRFGSSYHADLNLIVCNPDGSPLKPDTISATVSRYCRKLKLKGSLHTLRHSHASQLLAAGVPLTDVSARLGHSNVYVTATVYAHALPGHDDDAARAWERAQGRKVYPKSTGGTIVDTSTGVN